MNSLQNNNNNNRVDTYRDEQIVRREARNRSLLYAGIGILVILIAVILFFTFSNRNSHYEAGLQYLRNKQYNAAVTEFQYIGSDDKNYVMAQSKINFVTGLKAYNNSSYDEAKVYLSKVDERDEVYNEAKLMLEQIASLTRQENLENQLAQKNPKDTVIKEKIIETPSTIKNNTGTTNTNQTNNQTGTDEQAAKKYISGVQSVTSKFNASYQSAASADVESKRNYVKNMQSLLGQMNGLSYNSNEKNAMVIELKGMITKWMTRRIDFINRLISDNTVSETPYSRALKEEGDKLYNMAMRQMEKVKSYYNI